MASSDDFELVANKQGKSDIWQYFKVRRRRSDRMIDKSEAVCVLCDKHIKHSGGTTNLTTHMVRHHPSKSITRTPKMSRPVLKETTSCHSGVTATVGSSPSPTQVTVASMLTAKNKYQAGSQRAIAITDSIARFIVMDMRPFSVVANKGFQDMITVLDSRYTIPSRQFFSDRKIPEMYKVSKQAVKANLSTASRVALTTDGWTSRATESYVTITAHFITPQWTLQSYVLQTRAMPESHTGENIAEVLTNACEEWGIPLSPPLVTDNASNMTVAAKEAKCNPHIGCYAHTLNLAAQKALKVSAVNKLLGKVRRVVSFFHRSAVASAVLKKKIEQLSLPNHKLIQDVCTRWNSAADMLERFLELQPAVYATLTTKEVRSSSKDVAALLESDIYAVEDILGCLKPLRTITAALCTEQTPTISIIMPLQHQLLHSLMASSDSDSRVIKEMKTAVVDNLSTRYVANRNFLLKAALMDPRFKNMPFVSQEERFDVYNQVALAAVAEYDQLPAVKIKTEATDKIVLQPEAPPPSLPALPSEIDEENTPASSASAAPAEAPILIKEEASAQSAPPSGLASIFEDVEITSVEKKTTLERVTDELRLYKEEKQIGLQDNPLAWWKGSEHKLPVLANFARSVLCIPATSVPSERVFSTAGDIVNSQRANLKSEHVDMLIFLKKNLV